MDTSHRSNFPVEADGLFEMANLSPKHTGLPFVVWISSNACESRDPRLKVCLHSQMMDVSQWVSLAITPSVHVVGEGHINIGDLALLQRWVDLNYDVIVQYWDGVIEYTEDAISALRPLF